VTFHPPAGSRLFMHSGVSVIRYRVHRPAIGRSSDLVADTATPVRRRSMLSLPIAERPDEREIPTTRASSRRPAARVA
jgi:hypothetical protein